MRIEFVAPTIELDADQRQWAERRVLFAMGRFADRIRRVRVTLADVNGPRGGLDKECRVTAQLTRGDPLVAEVLDSDPGAALARAIDRITRQLATGYERRRDRRRRPRSDQNQTAKRAGRGDAQHPSAGLRGGLE